jgi:hypothetical protein
MGEVPLGRGLIQALLGFKLLLMPRRSTTKLWKMIGLVATCNSTWLQLDWHSKAWCHLQRQLFSLLWANPVLPQVAAPAVAAPPAVGAMVVQLGLRLESVLTLVGINSAWRMRVF